MVQKCLHVWVGVVSGWYKSIFEALFSTYGLGGQSVLTILFKIQFLPHHSTWLLSDTQRAPNPPEPKNLVGLFLSMPNMTGRPGDRTMEVNGGSSAPHLARTPCVPLFSTLFNRGGNRRAFRLPGAGGEHFHCTVEPSPSHIRCRKMGTIPPKKKLTNVSAPPAVKELAFFFSWATLLTRSLSLLLLLLMWFALLLAATRRVHVKTQTVRTALEQTLVLWLQSRLPSTDPKPGFRPEMGKKWPKADSWPTGKDGQKVA